MPTHPDDQNTAAGRRAGLPTRETLVPTDPDEQIQPLARTQSALGRAGLPTPRETRVPVKHQDQLPKRLSVPQAAHVLGVDRRTVWRAIERGQLKADLIFDGPGRKKPLVRISADELAKVVRPMPVTASGSSVTSPDVKPGRNGRRST